MSEEDKKLEERIKRTLTDNAEDIDSDTRRRLQEIRRLALKQPERETWFNTHYLIPAGGFTFISIVAAILLLPSYTPGNALSEQMADVEIATMLNLIENPDEVDMLSDPGFYVWMEEMESIDAGAA